jgi:hypothetical protein
MEFSIEGSTLKVVCLYWSSVTPTLHKAEMTYNSQKWLTVQKIVHNTKHKFSLRSTTLM